MDVALGLQDFPVILFILIVLIKYPVRKFDEILGNLRNAMRMRTSNWIFLKGMFYK